MSPDVLKLPMPWGVLGLRPTGDIQAVRRAYAALIRQYRPDSHPREFARIRQAYEQAQEQASYFSQYEQEEDEADEGEGGDEREAERDGPDPANQPDPVPVQLLAEHALAGSPGQPAVFIPLAEWDAAPDPGEEADPVSVTQPGDLPWPENGAPFAPPALQAVPVPLGNEDGTNNDESDAYITRPGLLPDWAALSLFNAGEQVRAMIRCWHINGEQAALTLLRQQLVQASQATIDASMEYQGHLMHWLLTSDEPSLGLVFEADRLLHWSANAHDIRLQLGDRATQSWLLRVQMAQDYVFCSRFSGKHWERLLFAAPARRVPWVAFTTSIQDARLRLQQWRDKCAQAGLPDLLGQLNPAVVRRIEGPVIYSTDIFLGLMLVLVKSDAGAFSGDGRASHLLLALLSVALVVAVCVGWRRLIRLSLGQRLWKRCKRYQQDIGNSGLAIIIGMSSLLAIFVLALEAVLPIRIVAGSFLAVVGLCLSLTFISGWWWLLLWLEAMLLQPWYRPSLALAGLGFLHLQASDSTGWAAPSLKERLRLLPAAASAAWQKRKLRKKNANASKSGAAPGMPRWVYWVGFVLLRNGLRTFLK
ncbi:MAG: J domain-containing protein [Pseudomonadota bacterium]